MFFFFLDTYNAIEESTYAQLDLFSFNMSAIKDGEAAGLHFRVSLPCSRGKQLPWILFLHGRDERGHSNGSELQLVQKHGPWHSLWSEHFVIIAPQCPRRKLW